MDELLSPSFSVGTPLYQLDEDQQIVGNYTTPKHMTTSSFGMPSQMDLNKFNHTYAPSFPTPQKALQPQTPHLLITPMTPVQDNSLGTPTTPIYPTNVPQLQNIVSTANFNCKLDLKKIAMFARNAEYNPRRFAAVIMRIREPRTTALIFSSGKMVCTGAKTEDQSRLAARKYARIIQKLGFPAKFSDFKIRNIVGSCDTGFEIFLEGLKLEHDKFCSYDPEIFPGLAYKMKQPKIVLLVFVSGKVVLTGAKVRQEIYDGFQHIYPILKSFKRDRFFKRVKS